MATAISKLKVGNLKNKVNGGITEDPPKPTDEKALTPSTPKVAKKNIVKGSVGVLNNKIEESFEDGTPLRYIINLPPGQTKQAALQSAGPTMDEQNRRKWANYQGFLTDYPKGKGVPVFRYTPAVLEDMKRRGITKEYIESWQSSNYRADGGLVDGKVDLSKIGELGGKALSDILSNLINKDNSGLQTQLEENRVNPNDAMAELDRKGIASNIVGSTLKGASTGMAAGPGGAVAGGIAGLATSVFNAQAGKGEREIARNEATNKWAADWTKKSTSAYAEKEYKEGGKIKGKGTGKSDDIAMKAPEGAFIVPAENSTKAMQLGKEYLGWKDDEVAKRNSGNIDINVSNGEVFFTPDEYDQLTYYGVDVDGLAPNAEKNKTGFCRGGKIKKEKGGKVRRKFNPGGSVEGSFDDYITNTENQIQKDMEAEKFGTVSKEPLPSSILSKFMDSVGQIAGAAQVAGGTAGLIASGKRPDVNVSTSLKRLSREVREAAGYGLPPAVKNAMKNEREKAFQSAVNQINSRGGSAQDMQQQTLSALSTKIAAGDQMEYVDYQTKNKKMDRVIQVDTGMAGQEYDISKIGLSNWEKDQDVWGNLLNTGISNIIGASQYKKELEIMEKNANKPSNFTIER